MAINENCVNWNSEEIALAVKVMRKIAYCQKNGERLPGPVFEAHVESKKNVSTELVVFDAEGSVLLIERPSLSENPTEPFPGELHVPGATHMLETESAAMRRLIDQELDGLSILGRRKILEVESLNSKRGIYRMIIYAALASGIPKDSHARFHPPALIPWDRLLRSHREVVLPAALQYYRASAGFSR